MSISFNPCVALARPSCSTIISCLQACPAPIVVRHRARGSFISTRARFSCGDPLNVRSNPRTSLREGRCHESTTALLTTGYKTGQGEDLADWIKAVIPDVVRNVRNAPCLHVVGKGHGTSRHKHDVWKLSASALTNGEWQRIKEEVRTGAAEGVILVNKLSSEDLKSCSRMGLDVYRGQDGFCNECSDHKAHVCGTEAWGLVVQAPRRQGIQQTSPAYVLLTTKVHCCDHTCTKYSIFPASKGTKLGDQALDWWLA